MKKVFILIAIAYSGMAAAQQFIHTALIEYEVKANVHKQMGTGSWLEQFKDQVPEFLTSYFHLVFNNNKSIYKLDRKKENIVNPALRDATNENLWYNDYSTKKTVQQKYVLDNTYLFTDSLMNIEWKLIPNETTVIAGFNCRKAQTKIFDSVYVFAFYTDEIVINAGPMSLHGLPGAILGVTIPRLYTSWIATKVQQLGVNTDIITAPTKGKKEQRQDMLQKAEKATKDWGEWGDKTIWNSFL